MSEKKTKDAEQPRTGTSTLASLSDSDLELLSTPEGAIRRGTLGITDETVAAEIALRHNMAHPTEGRTLKAGTVLKMADKDVTLSQDVIVNYDGEASEAGFVGMCHILNNIEANRPTFRFRYDDLGNRLPLDEQFDDEKGKPDFIKSLSLEEALSFGIAEETWRDYTGEAKPEADAE